SAGARLDMQVADEVRVDRRKNRRPIGAYCDPHQIPVQRERQAKCSGEIVGQADRSVPRILLDLKARLLRARSPEIFINGPCSWQTKLRIQTKLVEVLKLQCAVPQDALSKQRLVNIGRIERPSGFGIDKERQSASRNNQKIQQ